MLVLLFFVQFGATLGDALRLVQVLCSGITSGEGQGDRWILDIEPRSVVCKARILPALLALQP